ncbi:spore germination protein GerW family protein [Haladaptatus caseinilyticus]|uniref:spore germination protein GerW family protein n=1 Tax=Haladaptatus caseinilyticus TaxID=2993314 RepID=UPI00224B7970|nr:spore germination protein GerW family protein [Haladaptatus caseinilyticus]
MVDFDRIESAMVRFHRSGTVERVYGDPISVDDRTVVPVANVGYGFGGGGDDDGSGFGGGVRATPVGVVEISPNETRWIRFDESRRATLALVAGFVLGWLLKRRK